MMTRTPVALVLLVALAAGTGRAEGREGVFDGVCYHVETSVTGNWYTSHGLCEQMGAILAQPRTEDQHIFIFSLMEVVNIYLWVDLTDVQSEGTFVYQDGSVMAYEHWWPGEPNNEEGFGDTPCDCVAYKYDGDDLTMTDKLCSNNFHFVCQKPCPVTTMPMTSTMAFTSMAVTSSPTSVEHTSVPTSGVMTSQPTTPITSSPTVAKTSRMTSTHAVAVTSRMTSPDSFAVTSQVTSMDAAAVTSRMSTPDSMAVTSQITSPDSIAVTSPEASVDAVAVTSITSAMTSTDGVSMTSLTQASSAFDRLLTSIYEHPFSEKTTEGLFTLPMNEFATPKYLHNVTGALMWDVWTAWTACTRPCQTGTKVRFKLCSPGGDTQRCKHSLPWMSTKRNGVVKYLHERAQCNEHVCAVDGKWTNWAPWKQCSETCGKGSRLRHRKCIGPYSGGRQCAGQDYDVTTCHLGNCSPAPSLARRRLILEGSSYKESDRRPSAVSLGIFGIVFMIAVSILFLVLDLDVFCQTRSRISGKQARKLWNRTRKTHA